MSRGARWALLVFGVGLAMSVPWGGPVGGQMRDWPIPKNDIYWDESTLTVVSYITVHGWRTYIQQNWKADANQYCTDDNYSVLMNALSVDTYHTAKAKWVTHNGVRGRAKGEYLSGHNVIIAERFNNNISQQIGTVVHEAMHHTYVNNSGDTLGGYTDDPGVQEPNAVIQCVVVVGASEEDDEDDDDGGGGGGGGTGGGTWIWSPATSFEVCESFEDGENEDAECAKVNGDNPDDSGDYYHCGGITNLETVCWQELVEPGYWVWVEW